jgi:hypothetical protein
VVRAGAAGAPITGHLEIAFMALVLEFVVLVDPAAFSAPAAHTPGVSISEANRALSPWFFMA